MLKESGFPPELLKDKQLTHAQSNILKEFGKYYMDAAALSGTSKEKVYALFKQLVECIIEQIRSPHTFEIFHEAVRRPFDYYRFGLEIMRPLVDIKRSKVLGTEFLNEIIQRIRRGENVILLANHQTEPDPQIISLLLEPIDADFASRMIFIAGHRVVKDPMAIPFSLGRHLLCIYSKRHIANSPKKKKKNSTIISVR